MKNRNTILIAIVSGLACFALCQQVQSATDTPDPGSKPVSNTADGQNALLSISSGIHNAAFGFDALLSNTDANFNTAVGDDALDSNVDGSNNVAIGDEAGTGLGPSVNNCIAINVPGAGPFATFDNTCFIGSIFDQPVSDPGTQEAVFVDTNNVVGIFASSRRFKPDIQPMDKASEAILALKPVTFKYNSDV